MRASDFGSTFAPAIMPAASQRGSEHGKQSHLTLPSGSQTGPPACSEQDSQSLGDDGASSRRFGVGKGWGHSTVNDDDNGEPGQAPEVMPSSPEPEREAQLLRPLDGADLARLRWLRSLVLSNRSPEWTL